MNFGLTSLAAPAASSRVGSNANCSLLNLNPSPWPRLPSTPMDIRAANKRAAPRYKATGWLPHTSSGSGTRPRARSTGSRMVKPLRPEPDLWRGQPFVGSRRSLRSSRISTPFSLAGTPAMNRRIAWSTRTRCPNHNPSRTFR
jgi:hypothetical protein